jgi:3-phosphoshikimate 1-carboxyvinyltransferase
MAAVSVASPRTVTVPGDKSLSHRALMLAALAAGPSRLTGLLPSADVLSTAECLRRMGASIPAVGHDIVVDGRGMRSLHAPTQDLDCGNSGTSARLLTGLVAGLGLPARFIGDASLSKRPMRRVTTPLTSMGAAFVTEVGDGLPMRITHGVTTGIDFVSPTASAQVKSALLLAGLTAGVAVVVREPERSRDHTERMFTALGVPLTIDGTTVTLDAGRVELPGFTFDVPGDPSSAAFFAAYALLSGVPIRTSTVTVNPTRMGFFTVLARMGARITTDDAGLSCGEPTAALHIAGSLDAAATIEPSEVPSLIDELPLLACLGAYAPGETRVTGAQELRVKESDRISAVVANLRAIGADADELSDGFVVRGKPGATYAGTVATHGDHRLAMAFGILGALPGNDIRIDDPACVTVSFPTFWDTLTAVRA